MKIALFVHCFFPDHFYGTETYTLELARNLRGLGHEVTVVSAVFQGEPARDDLITRYEFDGIPVVVIDKNKRPHRNIRETYWQEDMRAPLRQVLQDLACDVVHVTHLINHTAVLLEEAKALDIPVVATLTDFFGFCYNNKLEAADGGLCVGPNHLRTNCIACHLKASVASGQATPAYRALRHPLLRSAGPLALRLAHAANLKPHANFHNVVQDITDRPGILFRAYQNYAAMIAPTTFLRDAYARNGFATHNLNLSRFGVDIDRSTKAPRTGPLTIGYVGQLAPHKGVDLLLAAAQNVPEGTVRINIHGPENQAPVYMTRLRELAGSHTSFLGTFPPERMAAVLADCDILAIPSTWYENSPLVLLYAMATHTPVLVADVQGLTEFVTEGQNGWSFRRGDLAHLTEVLRSLVADPALVRGKTQSTSYARDTRAMTEDVVKIYRAVSAA